VVLVAGFGVVCAAGVARAPRLISFQNDSPMTLAAASLSSSAAPEISNPVPVLLPVRAAWKQPAPAPAVRCRRAKKAPASAPKLAHKFGTNSDRGETVESAAIPGRNSDPVTDFLFHAAGMNVAGASETVVVVIQSNSAAGQPAYQIMIWRVTLPANRS